VKVSLPLAIWILLSVGAGASVFITGLFKLSILLAISLDIAATAWRVLELNLAVQNQSTKQPPPVTLSQTNSVPKDTTDDDGQ